MTYTIRLRIEESRSRFADNTEARRFAHLNGRTISAESRGGLDRELAKLGLAVTHGLGFEKGWDSWNYPTSEDGPGFRAYFLSVDRRRIGNEAKAIVIRQS